jgi:hemolysin activation/secretion protein
MVAIALAAAQGEAARAAEEAAPVKPAPGSSQPRPRTFDINEYRVEGVTKLSTRELEKVLNPFLGPAHTLEDVEKARAALEKEYSDRGFQTVTVAIPPQTVREGVVTLKVTEGTVGRLRVRGARYFSPSDVKAMAPSVAEGTVPNFNDIVHDIVALNQIPDRRVTPQLHAGTAPGTVDVDLMVEDALPLHGSLEFNNRYSPNTTPYRVNGALRYENLWQAGHTIGVAFQVAPERLSDAEVFSAYYLLRFPHLTWFTLTANGVVQNSDISTLGVSAVAGRGQVVGARANFTLPGTTGFYQTASAGPDWKHYGEGITTFASATQPAGSISTPITYIPLTVQYGANWSSESSQTQVNVTGVFNIRGLGSGSADFDAKRYGASGNFIYWRGDFARTDDLGLGLQLAERASGQYTPDPLVSPEQFTVGGVDSVRGYLEVQAAGDFGAAGSVEVRSPSLLTWFGAGPPNEWRFFAFADAGWTAIWQALPAQTAGFTLYSAGGGTRARLFGHLSGTLQVGVPFATVGNTEKGQPRVEFQVVGDF